jgi:hypothetical protein
MPQWPQYQNASLVTFANYVVKSAAYTAAPGDVVLVNATAGAVVIELPLVALGGPVVVKKTDSVAHNVTVKTSDSATVDGVAGSTGLVLSTQYATATFVSDGVSNWTVHATYQASATPNVIGWNFKTKTTTYTAVAGDFIVDTPAGAHTISLPTPVITGQAVAVKNVGGAHTITIKTTDSTTIDGITGTTGVPLAASFDTVVLVFDGTNWQSISGGPVVAGL